MNIDKHKVRFAILFAIVILVFSAVVLLGKTAVDNEFVAYENNPVMELGDPGDWDGGTIIMPEVLVVNDTFYLFYTGIKTIFSTPPAIGYATSVDGLTWTKHTSNPILTSDGSGFDAYYIANSAVIYDDGIWTLYYGGQPTPPAYPTGTQIGRATAPDPSGPWTRDTNPVLTLGGSGAWDSGYIEPNTVLKMADGNYVLYYTGGEDFLSSGTHMTGMATSSDGIIWEKYDDPTTVDAPFAESDPVLMPGAIGTWDSSAAWEGKVRQTSCGWEMYYSGSTGQNEASIGYATSLDGIHWTKDANNPIYEAADDPVTSETGDVVQVPSVIEVGNQRWMYYDYGLGTEPPAIGVAMAPLACHSVFLPTIMK